MDSLDRKLLNLLQRDASQTNAALAERVGLSPSTCLRRVQRLLREGVIERIVAILNPAATGRRLKAIVMVELDEHGDQHQRRFLELAVIEPAVAQAHAVTGRTDVVLVLRLQDMAEFDSLCERLFREDTGVRRFYTMVVIRTAKDETAIAL